MKEIKTEWGVVKYRLPNVSECFDVIACLSNEEGGVNHPLKAKKLIIENVVLGLIDHEDLGYSSKIEMFEDAEKMLGPISAITDLVYTFVIDKFNKKKESQTLTTSSKQAKRSKA